MMTAEFMLSKRPVLRFTAALFFLLKLFSSHIYCIDVFCLNCNFVIDAAVKQLISGSSLKYEVSAVTMAAQKIF